MVAHFLNVICLRFGIEKLISLSGLCNFDIYIRTQSLGNIASSIFTLDGGTLWLRIIIISALVLEFSIVRSQSLHNRIQVRVCIRLLFFGYTAVVTRLFILFHLNVDNPTVYLRRYLSGVLLCRVLYRFRFEKDLILPR
jgi:hypothetical protein